MSLWKEQGRSIVAKAKTPQGELAELVKQLPNDEWEPTRLFLRWLISRREDPVLFALATAPIDDEPFTDDDRERIRTARESVKAGRVVSHEEACRRLLG